MSESSTKAAALPPVPLDQVLVLVNRYLKSTALFLDNFAAQCDAKLRAVSERTADLEVELRLLEAKFGGVESPTDTGSSTGASTSVRAKSDSINETVRPGRPEPAPSETPMTMEEDSQLKPAMQASPRGEDLDPRLAKYRAMLKVGIPRAAITNKMQLDGVGDLADSL
jgi:hypothetical protein